MLVILISKETVASVIGWPLESVTNASRILSPRMGWVGLLDIHTKRSPLGLPPKTGPCIREGSCVADETGEKVGIAVGCVANGAADMPQAASKSIAANPKINFLIIIFSISFNEYS